MNHVLGKKVSGLSIIDLIANMDKKEIINYLKNNWRVI